MRPTPVLYLVSVLILLSLVLWAFFPILGFDFLTPETWHGIQDLSGKHVLVVKSGQSSRLGKPLPLVTTYVSLLVDRTLWQENALGYHLTNLLLHLIAGLLVLMIVYELAGDWLIAVAAALLYSVHPLHLQVVAPVTARSDLVYVCLFLGAFSAYLKSRSTGSARWVVTAVVLYVLTLLEKPAAIGFGLLILVHDRIFLEAEQRAKRLPWLLMGLGALLLLAFHLSGRLQTPWALYKGGPLSVMLSGAAHLGRYLGVIFWPRRSTFGLDLAVPPIWAGLVGLAGYAAVVGALWFAARRGSRVWKLALFGGLWFGLTLLADVNLLFANLNLFAASHLTLALLGCLLMLLPPMRAAFGDKAGGMLAMILLVFGLSVGLTTVTYKRSALWQDARTLWEDVLERDKQNYWASYHLSLYHAWRNRAEFDPLVFKHNLEQSRHSIEQAIASSSRGRYVFQERNYLHKAKLLNDLATAELGLAQIQSTSDNDASLKMARVVEQYLDLALADCKKARAIFLEHQQDGLYLDEHEERLTESSLETMLGTIYERRASYISGRTDRAALARAEGHFRKALSLSETATTLTNLAKVLVDLSRDDEAAELLEKALRLHPDSEMAYTMRGTLASNAKRPTEAIKYFTLALDRARFPASRADLHARLARVYLNLRQYRMAETHWANVLKIDPGNYRANWELVGLYINTKRWKEALRHLNQLIQHHGQAHSPKKKLAEIYLAMGDARFEAIGRAIIARRTTDKTGPVNDVELVNAAAKDTEILARLQRVSALYRQAWVSAPKEPAARQRYSMMCYFDAVGMLMVGNLKDGINQLAQVWHQFPEYTPALAMIQGTVQLLVRHGKWKKIHKIIKGAHARNPENKLLQALKVQLDLFAAQERQHPMIVRAAERRLLQDATDFKSNWVVGNHLAKKGDERKAYTHYGRALIHFRGEPQLGLNFRKEYTGWLIRWARRARNRVNDGKDQKLNSRLFHEYLKEALRLLAPEFRANPKHPEVANNVALIYSIRKEYGKGIAVLRRVEQKEAHHKKLLADMLFKRSLRAKRPRAKRRADLAEAIGLLGNAAPKRYRSALGRLDQANLVDRGMAAFAEGKLELARTLLEKTRPSTRKVRLILGRIYSKKGEAIRAISFFRLAADSTNPEALYLMAREYDKLAGRHMGTALDRYRRFLELHAKVLKNPVRYPATSEELVRWQGYAKLSTERSEALRQLYLRSLREGDQHYRAQRWQAAIDAFKRCSWIRPRDADPRYYHAVCLAKLRQTEKAVRQFEQVLRLDSSRPLAHFRLGVLYYGFGPGKYGKAIARLEQAIKLGLAKDLVEIAQRYLEQMRK